MGDAATPVLPDFTSQNAAAYKANIDAGFAVSDRLAWAFAPHEQDQGSPAPDMTVRLEAGALLDGTTLTEVAAQSTGVITAPTTDPRIDRVVIDEASGAVSVITGAEAASPTAPAITAGKVPVCQVALTTSQTEISNADLTDERTYAPSSGDSFASGTKMLFQQASAPTGWTLDTSHDNKALRISSGGSPFGSGGATAFTTVFGSGKTTGSHVLASNEIPINFNGTQTAGGTAARSPQTATGHTHTLSLDLQYVDVIIASKD